jgi:hypothetical protein
MARKRDGWQRRGMSGKEEECVAKKSDESQRRGMSG